MKTITIGLVTLFLGVGLHVKALDTLFYEDFESWNFIEIEDSIFTDYDEDGLNAANGLPGGWFVANFANGGADTTEVVAISASWLDGFLPGNRNWLMLPPIHLGDSSANLSWRSAPALGDLYLDGYTVLVSTNQYFYYDVNLADTLMHFAQNINENENDFSDGVVHTNFDYTAPLNTTIYTQYPGLLSTWTADLSAYNNQTIYIGFLHNSDDDNFIALDDILVTGKQGVPDTTGGGGPVPVGMDDSFSSNSIDIFPTVVDDVLRISLTQTFTGQKYIHIFDVAGKLLNRHLWSDNQLEQVLDLSDLDAGMYLIRVEFDKGHTTKKIIKK